MISERADKARLYFKRLDKLAIIPEYPKKGSSALILRAYKADFIMSGGTVEIPLGISVRIPRSTFGMISDSSYLAKQGVFVYRENIDEDFEGELRVRLHNAGPLTFGYQRGSVVGYLTIVPFSRKKVFVEEED